jgi:hypothetical protein
LDGSDRVGTGLKRVGSSTSFFQKFLPAPVLDPPVLTGHGSDGFEHGSDLTRSGFFKTLSVGRDRGQTKILLEEKGIVPDSCSVS